LATRGRPYAHTEATALSELFGVAPVLGDDVTRAAFERAVENVDIVHFAGHSDFDASQPLRSGLRLAGDDTLTSSEVFGLKGLHAHLVTLSGCETA
jgi:CHAT domain-containing protein